jgi:enterochelin esterase family protein
MMTFASARGATGIARVGRVRLPHPRFIALAVTLALTAACSTGAGPTITTATPSSVTTVATTTTATIAPATTTTTTPLGAELPGTAGDLDALLARIDLLPAAQAAEAVDRLWGRLTGAGRIPFVDGDHVVFLYRGEAEGVDWRGDFSGWSGGLLGRRISQTDLWAADATLPGDARIEYRIVLDGGEWIVDPGNPDTQMGGYGPNSVLTMPGFVTTDFTTPDPGAPSGTLTEDIPFESGAMGYTIDVRVYIPAAAPGAAGYPVLYVTDGSDFWDPQMGAMTVVADNLIAAGRIEPVMAVFPDAWDPEHTVNRRESEFLERPADYARFLAEELIPWVDATYPTDPRRERRAIVGTSYGGVGAAFFSALQPEAFEGVVMFSPAVWALGSPESLDNPARAESLREMTALLEAEARACEAGECASRGQRTIITSGIPEWDVGDLSGLAATFEAIGLDYLVLQTREGHSWGAWSGLTDEVLEFLFPAAGWSSRSAHMRCQSRNCSRRR